MGSMGDEAETKFEELHPSGFVRFGLNRPPISMGMLPPSIRYTPDYLTSHGLVEVQGVGRDRILKLKIDKAMALQQWHQMFKLQMFVWDTTRQEAKYMDWETLWGLLPSMPIDHFPEGKPYWQLNVDQHLWVENV